MEQTGKWTRKWTGRNFSENALFAIEITKLLLKRIKHVTAALNKRLSMFLSHHSTMWYLTKCLFAWHLVRYHIVEWWLKNMLRCLFKGAVVTPCNSSYCKLSVNTVNNFEQPNNTDSVSSALTTWCHLEAQLSPLKLKISGCSD